MAAYAALLSLKYIIQQIQLHPRPPISFDQNQVDSLTKSLNFLQDFLEGYSYGSSSISREAVDVLESRIADAAHAAEDIIETRIVDQIRGGGRINSVDFYQDLEKVIQEMGFIKKDVMEIKEKNIGIIEDRLHIYPSTLGGSSSSPLPMKQIAVVGLDDQLIEVMDKLTGQPSYLRIISIVGMGGIGKTTLAINAYTNPLITEQFDIRAWVTISQTYNVREILVEILLCATKDKRREIFKDKRREIFSGMSEGELGERVHKSLWGRRYLIVLDDIWSAEAWDKVNRFFPDNGQGSRIMITTRLSDVASIGSHGLVMDLLDDDKSWDLLCGNIFGKEEDCPIELEEIGKKIAKKCKGLPLSIVVIGGLLAKLNPTRENWEYISENLNSIVNLEDNERCLKVLHLSYHHLPVHLKPCFLYMGVFPEDSNIRVPRLVKLWVSEGFLKPIRGKSLEVVSREYLEDLCDRNLIRVHQRGTNGRIKFCTIHDLVRELCLREAEKEKFLYVRRPHDLNTPQGIINTQRRICIHQSTTQKKYLPEALHALQSVPLARSLCFEFEGVLPSLDHCRLLRVLRAADTDLNSFLNPNCTYTLEDVFQLVNSRYLAVDDFRYENLFRFPSSVYHLWNLQTLIVKSNARVVAPSEIWKMTQLRHVLFRSRLEMPDPPLGGQDGEFILGNLQTLSRIRNFKCGEEVVKRIPNINNLQIYYDGGELEGYFSSYYCLNNLVRLGKLESFACYFDRSNKPNRNDMLQNFIIPNSLKMLTLGGTHLIWEDMKMKIGWLPNLEVLKLKYDSFVGAEWETVEGQFCNLRFLKICDYSDLEWWTTDSTHFPRLEQLELGRLKKLKEIPSCIGEIPTLGSIVLKHCSKSAVISAKEILDEQKDLDNVGLRVRVRVFPEDKQDFESLASPNFQVET